MNQKITPYVATHPGEVLKDELIERGIKQKDFAFEISMQATMLNEILKGKRPITADIAILIEKALGISADYWMKFQVQYEIDNARIKEKNIKKVRNLEKWQKIKKLTPIKFYRQEGVISDDIVKDTDTILQIYKVNSVNDIEQELVRYASASFYRKSEKLKVDDKNIFGWSRLVSWYADQEKVKAFDKTGFKPLKRELHEIFYKNTDVRENTKNVLSNYGIKLIFLKKFDKTPIDGFSFWSSENPAIGLTFRHKRIDNFAFTIFHELGHIFEHLNKDRSKEFIDLESGVENSGSRFEIEADNFAQEHLISTGQWEELKSVAPWNDQKVYSFSEKHGINPAIVLGRICWETNDYAIRTTINKCLN